MRKSINTEPIMEKGSLIQIPPLMKETALSTRTRRRCSISTRIRGAVLTSTRIPRRLFNFNSNRKNRSASTSPTSYDRQISTITHGQLNHYENHYRLVNLHPSNASHRQSSPSRSSRLKLCACSCRSKYSPYAAWARR